MAKVDVPSDTDLDGSSNMSSSPSKRAYNRYQSRVPVTNVQDEPLLQQAKAVINKQRDQYKEETAGFTWFDWLAFFIPCFQWLRTYQVRNWLLVSTSHINKRNICQL